MVYIPKEPANVEDMEGLINWLVQELRSISSEFSETTALDLRLVGREPLRPREGMIVAANGTTWDPGGGKGIYAFLGTAWVKLS